MLEATVNSQTYRRSPLVQGGLEVPIRLKISVRPTKLNEKLLMRHITIHDESYEDPGPESLKEINLTSAADVDFNIKSLLPEKAGPKKRRQEWQKRSRWIYARCSHAEEKGRRGKMTRLRLSY